MTAPLTQLDTQARPTPPVWLGASVVAAIICVVLAFTNPQAFWAGYLVGAVFWLSISCGCLGLTLILGTTGGRWGLFLFRELHAGVGTLLTSLLCFAVLLLGAKHVFPWADAKTFEHLNPHQQILLNPPTVWIGFAVTALIWLAYAFMQQARYKKVVEKPKVFLPQFPPAMGILVFFLTFAMFAVNFMMALTPAWASSMYPVIRTINCAVSALAICVIWRLNRLENQTWYQNERVLELGNLLQGFNILWTYTSFSQYVLIWTGDISHEVDWFVQRQTPFWTPVSFILFGFHFLTPFLLLLARPVKRSRFRLTAVAGLLLAMCFLDCMWTLIPSTPGQAMKGATFAQAIPPVLAALASGVAIGGLWLFTFQRKFASLAEVRVHETHNPAETHAVDHPAGATT